MKTAYGIEYYIVEAPDPRTHWGPTHRPHKKDLPLTAALLHKLQHSMQYKNLDILAAISEFVAFLTQCDQTEPDPAEEICKMSGKKCRNCY